MNVIKQAIAAASHADKPAIHFIKKANLTPRRLGIFASSFNPFTTAHLELMQRASAQFALDETLALAGMANADKSDYECSIEDRLMMLRLALGDDPHLSIGLSSHAFFIDKLEALAAHYDAETELHFILGFDTFERVLDRDDHYTKAYYRKFKNRAAALESLLTCSRFIIASRAGAHYQAVASLAKELLTPRQQERLGYLDFPAQLGEQSATKVRQLIHSRLPIAGLVPETVARYIIERGLYR